MNDMGNRVNNSKSLRKDLSQGAHHPGSVTSKALLEYHKQELRCLKRCLQRCKRSFAALQQAFAALQIAIYHTIIANRTSNSINHGKQLRSMLQSAICNVASSICDITNGICSCGRLFMLALSRLILSVGYAR